MKGEIKKALKDVDAKYIDPSCELGVQARPGRQQPAHPGPTEACQGIQPVATQPCTCTPTPPPADLIRSIPATSDDRVYCKMLAHGAVHAAFAGYTNVAVGQVNTHVVYLPLHLLVQAPRQVGLGLLRGPQARAAGALVLAS